MKELLDDERIRIAIVAFLIGVVLTFIMYPKPELETVYKFTTKTETDTSYVEIKDTVYVPKTKIKTQVLRDTVVVNFKPTIKSFETTFPFEHGSTKVSGEVLGEVTKMTAVTDYKLPTVTNTVTETKTETIIKKSKGIYIGANVNSLLQLGAGVSYVDNKYIFQYQYQPVTRIHSLGVSKKLF